MLHSPPGARAIAGYQISWLRRDVVAGIVLTTLLVPLGWAYAELDAELNGAGTFLVLAELKDPVRVKLERYELIGPLDPAYFFPMLDAAVDAFRGETGADPTSTMNASG